MNEKAAAFLAQIRSFWAGLSTAKRVVLVLGTLTVLGATLLISSLNSRINYGYLFTELEPQDAAAIVQELKKRNIPHQIEAGGTAILVPEEQRHSLRLELASDGLPRGGAVGFELFDKAQIGATEFEQQVSLRRALEGELSRSISTLEGVQNARVHLVMPERKLFATRSEGASASVVIKLRTPSAFGRREIAGVVHLVSAAVPGLSRDHVSVVSTEGVTLHRPSEDSSGVGGLDGSDARSEQEHMVGSRMEQDVREQLERVVGAGNADVRINVTLDAAVTERTEEYFDKDTTALRSEHLVEEGIGATEAGVAGVPGARTNLPDAAPQGEAPAEDLGGAVGAGMRRARTRNWEVDRVTEKTNLPPGSVQRLSVAVLLNGSYEGSGAEAKFVGRSPEQVQALEQVVRRAVGFNTERGDQIVVQGTQFARINADEAPPTPQPVWQRNLPYAAGALALLVILATWILVRRGKAKKEKKLQLALAEAARQQPALGDLTTAQQIHRDMGHSMPPDALPANETGAPQLLHAPAEHELRELAVEFATRDPATAAVVLKKWLASADAVGANAA